MDCDGTDCSTAATAGDNNRGLMVNEIRNGPQAGLWWKIEYKRKYDAANG
jgi:hypothetical protein